MGVVVGDMATARRFLTEMFLWPWGVTLSRGPVELGGRLNAWTDEAARAGVSHQPVEKP